MDLKDEYFLKRRQKKISMQKIANYIGCSQSLISRYEINDCNMSNRKIEMYRKFINEYIENK